MTAKELHDEIYAWMPEKPKNWREGQALELHPDIVELVEDENDEIKYPPLTIEDVVSVLAKIKTPLPTIMLGAIIKNPEYDPVNFSATVENDPDVDVTSYAYYRNHLKGQQLIVHPSFVLCTSESNPDGSRNFCIEQNIEKIKCLMESGYVIYDLIWEK